jgi:hypothetical protein
MTVINTDGRSQAIPPWLCLLPNPPNPWLTQRVLDHATAGIALPVTASGEHRSGDTAP